MDQRFAAPVRTGTPGAVATWLAFVLMLLLLPGSAAAGDPSPPPSAAPAPSPTGEPASSAHAAPAVSPGSPAPPAPSSWLAPALTLGSVPVSGPITFYGRGYGHGVGLSQYGARGRALAGQDASTILAHYFPGTTIAATDSSTVVRVLVLSGFSPSSARLFVLFGRRGAWAIDGIGGVFPADAALRLAKMPAGWQLTVSATDGATLAATCCVGDVRVRPVDPATVLQLWSKPSVYDTYRGTLRIVAGSRISVINEVALDDYLAGVVPAEMPSDWPAEALRAQAVAARSYAARRLHRTTRSFDLYDDTRSQVYRGVRGEKPATTAAVMTTSGWVLLAGADVADTVFHSTGGGATEDNETAWVSASGVPYALPVAYLRGTADRREDGRPWDDASPYAAWATATYDQSTLSAIFAADARTNVGMLSALRFDRRGVSGRVVAVTLIGSGGSRTVSGAIFRTVFNSGHPAGDPPIRSTLVDVVPVP